MKFDNEKFDETVSDIISLKCFINFYKFALEALNYMKIFFCVSEPKKRKPIIIR